MMEKYDRAVCTSELRLRSSIFGLIKDRSWVPTAAFEVPKELEGGEVETKLPPALQVNPQVNDAMKDPIPEETVVSSDECSSTSSITWGNKSDCLSEVDIADLGP